MPTSFYIFTWNLLNTVNGPSPARPTVDSRTNLTVPAQQERKTLQPSRSCAGNVHVHSAQEGGEGCLERGLLEAQQSSVLFFPFGQGFVVREGILRQERSQVEAIEAGRSPCRRVTFTRAPRFRERATGDGLEREPCACQYCVHRASSPSPPADTGLYASRSQPVSLSQTGMGTVDRAEVLRPDCSSSNPGPESWASERGRMLVSTEDVS